MVFDFLVQNRDRSSNNNAHNKPTLRSLKPADPPGLATNFDLFPGFVPDVSVVFIGKKEGESRKNEKKKQKKKNNNSKEDDEEEKK